jgi:energy-coupling factor transport system permease protein
VRGRSWVHRLDPRSRLLLTGTMFVLALASQIVELAVLIAVASATVATAHVLKRYSKSMLFALGLAVFTFLLDHFLLVLPIETAVTYALRLFAVVSISSIYFLTTTPDELELVLRWFRFPADFVMIFVIAVRFVPVLLLDALQIMDAQRSRGLEFDKGGFTKRMRNTVPVLVPLIAVAVNRSLDLAEAMDSRAYGALKKTTSLYELKFGRLDYAVCFATLFFAAIGLYLAFFVP